MHPACSSGMRKSNTLTTFMHLIYLVYSGGCFLFLRLDRWYWREHLQLGIGQEISLMCLSLLLHSVLVGHFGEYWCWWRDLWCQWMFVYYKVFLYCLFEHGSFITLTAPNSNTSEAVHQASTSVGCVAVCSTADVQDINIPVPTHCNTAV